MALLPSKILFYPSLTFFVDIGSDCSGKSRLSGLSGSLFPVNEPSTNCVNGVSFIKGSRLADGQLMKTIIR